MGNISLSGLSSSSSSSLGLSSSSGLGGRRRVDVVCIMLRIEGGGSSLRRNVLIVFGHWLRADVSRMLYIQR